MIRLAALGLSHEANTFAPTHVGLDSFTDGGLLHGEEIVERHAEAQSTMAGYLAVDSVPQVSVIPLLFTSVTPAGEIERSAFESILGEMVSMVAQGGPWDGILLALHGAAVAEGYPDADGEILRRIREIVGPQAPIGVAADLHANVSVEMIRHADVFVTYRTNPHIDARDRALDTGGLIVRAVRGEVRPEMALEQVPAALSILAQNTDEEPMRSLLEARAQLAAGTGVLSASVVSAHIGVAAGVGARCRITVGAERDAARGPVLELDVTIQSVHDGRYYDNGPTHAGQSFFDTGPTCLVSYDDNCLMVLTSKPDIPSSLAQLHSLGVEPETMDIIVAKGVNSPLTAYGRLAADHIVVDSPGITPADPTRLSYRRRRRPLYPFESQATYPSEDVPV